MSGPEPMGRVIDGWQLVGVLGQGGMGAVYRARNAALRLEGALKVVPAAHATANGAARLKREVELLRRLSHPGIVRTLAAGGLPDGRPYYVMEIVEGKSLETIIRTDAPLEPRRAATLVAKIARALGHAHGEAIVHRDVKPQNVLVRPDGSPVVLDFGLAKALFDDEAERLSMTGQLMGTLHYMSPEQAAGLTSREIGPTSDVFSLGVVLYELLSGRRPFDGETPMELLARIQSGTFTPPGEIVHALPPAIEAISWKALSHEKGGRYEDGNAFASDLERFLAGKSVAAPAVRGVGRLARRPGARLSVVLAALGTASVLGLVAVLASHARPEATGPSGPSAEEQARVVVPTLRVQGRETAASFRLGARDAHERAAALEALARSGEATLAKLAAGDPARVELGRALADARATLAALRELDPKLGSIDGELRAARVDLGPEPDTAILAAVRGLTLAAAGKTPDAIPLLERAARTTGPEREAILELFPWPRIDEALARALLALDRPADATAVLDRALAVPKKTDAKAAARLAILRAHARVALGDFERALADGEAGEAALGLLEPGTPRDPAFARAYAERGRRFLEERKQVAAARAFREAGERDPTVFSRDLARRAAAVIEHVAVEDLRVMTTATAPADAPTADKVRAAHAALDLALALDPDREKAPADLVYMEKVLAQRPERIPGVRFLVAARLRRLGVAFDPHGEVPLYRVSDGEWGQSEEELRADIAAAGGDTGKVVDAYTKFSHNVRPLAPEVAYEGEEEMQAIATGPWRASFCIERGVTLAALGRLDESARMLDEAVTRARALGDDSVLAGALFWRGTKEKDAHKFEQAVLDLREATTLLDKTRGAWNGAPWLDLATALHGLGRDEEARAAFATAKLHGGVDTTDALKLEGELAPK